MAWIGKGNNEFYNIEKAEKIYAASTRVEDENTVFVYDVPYD